MSSAADMRRCGDGLGFSSAYWYLTSSAITGLFVLEQLSDGYALSQLYCGLSPVL